MFGSSKAAWRPSGMCTWAVRTDSHEESVEGSSPSASRRRSAAVVRPSPQHLSRGKMARSSKTTRRPARAAMIEAAAPAGPAPTIVMSQRSILMSYEKGAAGQSFRTAQGDGYRGLRRSACCNTAS